jgi:hypothetical protein
MLITNAQYLKNDKGELDTVRCSVDGTEMFVPLDPNNRHYAEILRQVKEGTLTIKDADE